MNLRLPLPAFPIPGDYLARLLRQGDLGWGLLLAGVVVAFALGAIHALSPGHGKTIVAAYLVGTRGTPLHAAFLGAIVTFTHTITVFFLGFATLFLSRYVLPEKIYPVLGVVSGISIVWIGAVLLYQRAKPHHHHHDHDHGDGHIHVHEASMTNLVALGASGGLVPCPTALVLLLTAVSLGRTGLGLVLLVAFSAGLAVVLTLIGLLVLYAKHWLPDGQKAATHAVFRYLPMVSAAIIVCIGAAMTWVSLRRP